MRTCKNIVDIATGKFKLALLTVHDGPGHMTIVDLDVGWGAEPLEEQLKDYMGVLSTPQNNGWRERLH